MYVLERGTFALLRLWPWEAIFLVVSALILLCTWPWGQEEQVYTVA